MGPPKEQITVQEQPIDMSSNRPPEAFERQDGSRNPRPASVTPDRRESLARRRRHRLSVARTGYRRLKGAITTHFSRTKRNCKAIRGVLFWFTIWLLFSVLYLPFIYHVLIMGNPQVSRTFFDAPTTNLLVSILSQIFVILADMAVRGLLSALRTALAMRGNECFITFLGIGSTSEWLAVVEIWAFGWFPNLWRSFTFALLGEGALLVSWLGLPIMGLAFSSVLKFQATFDYIFLPGSGRMDVFAGPIGLDNRVLSVIPQAVLCLYFQGQTASLLANAKYATSFPVDRCGNGCRSIALPGGLEMARQSTFPTQNHTLFEGDLFDATETIRTDDAPAFVLTFQNIYGGSLAVDPQEDCVYAGQSFNDTLQMCVIQAGQGISVGWRGCPLDQYTNHTCNDDLGWTTAPLKWATTMTAYRQRMATAYDRQNFSIVDVSPTGDLKPVALTAGDYMTILRRILVPAPGATAEDVAGVSSLAYSLTWLHRTEQGYFPHDQNSLVTNLHNFLTIPLQFTVTAVQFANYSQSVLPFPMADESRTTATAGASQTRLVILPWTGWLFIIAAALLLALVAVGIVSILSMRKPLPPTSGLGDIDILRSAGQIEMRKRHPHHVSASDRNTYRDEAVPLAKAANRIEGDSAWKLAQEFRKWNVCMRNGSPQ